jgi:hypothetical protein
VELVVIHARCMSLGTFIVFDERCIVSYCESTIDLSPRCLSVDATY